MNEDTLVKMGLEALLSPFVEVRTQHEVQSPAQYVDVFVATEASVPEQMWRALGWLGRMASSPTLIEAFSGVVSGAEARACQRKQLAWHHSLELSQPEQSEAGNACPVPPLPPVWLLSCGRPRGLLRSWGMSAAEGWPAGFYQAPPGFGLWVVDLRELPRTRETLPLRLFGDERARQGLRRELDRLRPDDPMRPLVSQMLFRWTLWLVGQPEDEGKRRMLVDYHQVIEEQLKRIKDEAKAEARLEDRRESIADLCQVLDIALTPERKAKLEALDLDGLEALRQALKQHRRWPEG